MLIITEDIDDVQYLKESVGPDGLAIAPKYYIEGVFLQANVFNKNNRYYPKEILTQEVARYITTFINPNRAFGELGHPDGPIINLDRTSHMIQSLKESGNDWYGKALILDTPYGKIVKNFIDVGAKLAVSSRCLGSLKKTSSGDIVQSDLRMVTAGDIVADPSAPGAFVRGIMEGCEWFQDEATGEWFMNEVESIIRETPFDRTERENKFINLFEGFVSKL